MGQRYFIHTGAQPIGAQPSKAITNAAAEEFAEEIRRMVQKAVKEAVDEAMAKAAKGDDHKPEPVRNQNPIVSQFKLQKSDDADGTDKAAATVAGGYTFLLPRSDDAA